MLAIVTTTLLLGGCAREYHITTSIHPDGSSVIHTRMAMERVQAESIARAMQRQDSFFGPDMDDNGQGWEDVYEAGVIPPPPEAQSEESSPTEDEPLSDEQLIELYKQMISRQSPLNDIEGISQEFVDVTVADDVLHVEMNIAFDSLQRLVEYGEAMWQGVGVKQLRIETDEEGRVVLTLRPGEQMSVGPNEAQLSQMLKMSGFKGSFRLELPGNIVSSSLPNTDAAATWIAVDAAEEASMDAFAAIYGKPITVVAELGGLEVEGLPLDSQEIGKATFMGRGEKDAGAGLPIQEATDGYYAEAQNVATTTFVVLPDSEKVLDGRLDMMRQQFGNGTQVQVTLYAATERKILSVGRVEVDEAFDDQQRPLQQSSGGDGRYSYHSGDDDMATGSFMVMLDTPAPDAHAIEHLEGSVVVTAFREWRRHALEQVKANPDKVIDISDVLSDATLTVKRYRRGGKSTTDFSQVQGQFQIEVTGPKEVAQLDFTVEVPDVEQISAYTQYDQSQTGDDGRTTRTVMVQYQTWQQGAINHDNATLVVRFPDGVVRERVPFTLDAIDLF
jgi:hypothetical protein